MILTLDFEVVAEVRHCLGVVAIAGCGDSPREILLRGVDEFIVDSPHLKEANDLLILSLQENVGLVPLGQAQRLLEFSVEIDS